MATLDKLNQMEVTMSDFEPKIVGFLCNWCSYRGADLAGTARMKCFPNVRAIRVMCSGRVQPDFILKAFQLGADGVFPVIATMLKGITSYCAVWNC